MARLAFLIGWKDCLVRFQSRMTLIFVVVLPLAMTIVSGLAFKGFEPPKDVYAKIALIETQPSDLWERASPKHCVLEERHLSPDEASQAVKAKEIDAAIVVGPRGATEVKAELIVHTNKTPQRALAEMAHQQIVDVLGQGLAKANVTVQTQETAVGEAESEGNFNSFSQAVLG